MTSGNTTESTTDARPHADLPQRRRSGTSALWGFIGALSVAWMAWMWGGWLLGGSARQPSPGADHYRFLWVLRGTEALSVSVLLGLGWTSLVRPLRARRGLTLDGKLFIGGLVASSMDVMYGYFNPTWAINAHAVSLGTWSERIPGFANHGEQQNAWGLLWCLPAYIWLGLGAAMIGTVLLDQMRRRLPHWSTVRCYVLTLAAFYVAFALIENIWLRTQVYTYVSVPSGLTLWSGRTYQFPIYSPLLIGLYCLSYTWLRDSRDADGFCAVDRDLAESRLSHGTRQALSLLAVIGYAGATTMLAYQIPWTWLSMTGGNHGTVPQLPSYLRTGIICGQPGQPLCASQYLGGLK